VCGCERLQSLNYVFVLDVYTKRLFLKKLSTFLGIDVYKISLRCNEFNFNQYIFRSSLRHVLDLFSRVLDRLRPS
jgi:hypothetical protein